MIGSSEISAIEIQGLRRAQLRPLVRNPLHLPFAPGIVLVVDTGRDGGWRLLDVVHRRMMRGYFPREHEAWLTEQACGDLGYVFMGTSHLSEAESARLAFAIARSAARGAVVRPPTRPAATLTAGGLPLEGPFASPLELPVRAGILVLLDRVADRYLTPLHVRVAPNLQEEANRARFELGMWCGERAHGQLLFAAWSGGVTDTGVLNHLATVIEQDLL